MAGIKKSIGFIGTGQMATALACGFLDSELIQGNQLLGYDVVKESATKFQKLTHGVVCDSPLEILQRADIIFFAVKPQQMQVVLQAIKSTVQEVAEKKLFISIAAGLPIRYYENILGDSIRLVRVMPNTPCLVGEAASGFAVSQAAYPEDAPLAKQILETVGLAFELPEKLLDAVTGLSGSGPAYVFMAIEALADGGVKMGLPRPVALELAAQTLKGSAEMFLATHEHPGSLKDRVTSPAGTTIAGVDVLEQHGFRAALISAVEAATVRSRELGQ